MLLADYMSRNPAIDTFDVTSNRLTFAICLILKLEDSPVSHS
jgi:hypothetical protein